MKQKPFSLNTTHLRILALFLMLVDHLGRTVFPQFPWMMILGRLAFPIFAFQTAEGYRHTHNFKGYCKRLAIFALVSEIPFNLMVSGSLLYPSHQNVMVTMLLGLLACRAYDRKKRGALSAVAAPRLLLYVRLQPHGRVDGAHVPCLPGTEALSVSAARCHQLVRL